jgi:hypothetical protein
MNRRESHRKKELEKIRRERRLHKRRRKPLATVHMVAHN